MDGANKLLPHNGFRQSKPVADAPSLSELVWEAAKRGRRGQRSWRDTHGIDAAMRAAFGEAADTIGERNRVHHRGSYRLNVMLTVNTAQVARCTGRTAGEEQARLIQNVRNLYRDRPHRFMGVWRREWLHGEHLHLLTHAPRLMRARMMEGLPAWLDDPVDPCATSSRFNRRVWQVSSKDRTWHLCRLHTIVGALDYISKVPLGKDGEPLSTADTRQGIPKGAREFGIIGALKAGKTVRVVR